MALQEHRYKLTGVAPLIMHNCRLANPLDAYVRAMKPLTDQRNKTDDVLAQIQDLEWRGGLWENDAGEPCIPADAILKMLSVGAPQVKKNLRKAVESGVHLFEDAPILPGLNIDKALRDPRYRYVKMVKVGMSRVLRCRPIFREWSVEIALHRNDSALGAAELDRLLKHCGEMVGLGERRPRFGRFTVESVR